MKLTRFKEIKMKKYILIMFLMLFVGVSFADELSTAQMTAILVNEADSNDSAFDVNTVSWSVAKLWPEISSRFNGIKVVFYAYDPNDPNDETFSYDLRVADYGCNAQATASGTATVGGSQMSHNPISLAELNGGAVDPNYCYVDTLGAITSTWGSSITPQNYGGANDIASFRFDRQSAKTIWCRIYSRSNEDLIVYCIIYGY